MRTTPAFQPWYPPPIVVEKQYLDAERIRIVVAGAQPAEYREWIVHPDTPFNMPLRTDGSTKTWETTPIVNDIRAGDRVQNHTIVKLGRRGTLDPFVCTLYTTDDEGKSHEFRVTKDQPLDFRQMKPDTPKVVGTVQERLKLPAYGPYVYGERRYFFRVHPYGRGRWPGYIPKFVLDDSPGEIECRPPSPTTGRQYWDQLDFIGKVRHPSDPA